MAGLKDLPRELLEMIFYYSEEDVQTTIFRLIRLFRSPFFYSLIKSDHYYLKRQLLFMIISGTGVDDLIDAGLAAYVKKPNIDYESRLLAWACLSMHYHEAKDAEKYKNAIAHLALGTVYYPELFWALLAHIAEFQENDELYERCSYKLNFKLSEVLNDYDTHELSKELVIVMCTAHFKDSESLLSGVRMMLKTDENVDNTHRVSLVRDLVKLYDQDGKLLKDVERMIESQNSRQVYNNNRLWRVITRPPCRWKSFYYKEHSVKNDKFADISLKHSGDALSETVQQMYDKNFRHERCSPIDESMNPIEPNPELTTHILDIPLALLFKGLEHDHDPSRRKYTRK